jgi:hypothetical protein
LTPRKTFFNSLLVNYRRENGECNYSCGRGFDQ